MKKKTNLFLLLFTLSIMVIMAQEKKSFTLEDLIPGGSNYYNCSPKNLYGVQWWGDVCIKPDMEEAKTIDPKTGEEATLFTLKEINQVIQDNKLPYKLLKPLKPLRHLMSGSYPWADRSILLCATQDEDGSLYQLYYDFQQKKITNLFRIQSPKGKTPENIDFCPASGYMAYTIGKDLYIAHEGDFSTMVNPSFTGKAENDPEKEVVYGQAVHRNEFGIMKGTFWSPKGNLLAFYRMDQSMVTDYPQVDISTRIATLVPDKYPMAGMTSHKVTVGIYNPQNGQTVYLKAGDPTDRYFTNISWSPDETKIYMIELNRDQNHAELIRYDATTGDREAVIYEEKHPKYVEPSHPLTFLPWDASKFIYQTQRDGFNHLYLFDTQKPLKEETFKAGKAGGEYRETVKVTPLTQGDWLVQDIIGFNAKKKEIFIQSTEVSPLQSNIYAVNVNNGKRRAIGNSEGVHRVQLSGSGTYLIDNYTTPGIPRNIDIVSTTNQHVQNLFSAPNPWEEFNVPEVEVGTIKAADGQTDLYYRMIKPVHFDPNKKYPAVVYVYGGPHAQMINASYHYGARGWDVFMAQEGYVMFTIDNRGSENRGIEFENCTFRQLGVEEMKDQLKGVDYLKSLPFIDGNRLGVHGWSFGGFMTTNLMLSYPDVFKVGVAGGPVIDWKYYEIMYGERYMDTPQANPEGYKGSNLNEKAGNLKGRLEIIYGGNDPTCVPQHTLSFIRSCIDKGTHPDLFTYPGQGHNMVGKDRVHLHEHITRYFKDHLK